MMIPEYLKSVTHPLITSSYLKKIENGSFGYEDVLVIESRVSSDGLDHEKYMMLLSDLADIRKMAEKEVGTFDRVDIRMCH